MARATNDTQPVGGRSNVEAAVTVTVAVAVTTTVGGTVMVIVNAPVSDGCGACVVVVTIHPLLVQ